MLVPGFSDPRVERNPLHFMVTKNKRDLAIEQLSDGEKCLIGMVADLARRLAIANPKSDKPLCGDGVVLIDEIELHLHPAWQRDVVPRLRQVFPKCQFIVSTHSPQVLADVENRCARLLEVVDGALTVRAGAHTLGHDSNYILDVVLGVGERPAWAKDEIDGISRDIDEGKTAEARLRLATLEKRAGNKLPELDRLAALLERRELGAQNR